MENSHNVLADFLNLIEKAQKTESKVLIIKLIVTILIIVGSVFGELESKTWIFWTIRIPQVAFNFDEQGSLTQSYYFQGPFTLFIDRGHQLSCDR